MTTNHDPEFSMREIVGGPWGGARALLALTRYIIPMKRSDGMTTLPPEEWMCYEGRPDGRIHFVAITKEPHWPSETLMPESNTKEEILVILRKKCPEDEWEVSGSDLDARHKLMRGGKCVGMLSLQSFADMKRQYGISLEDNIDAILAALGLADHYQSPEF